VEHAQHGPAPSISTFSLGRIWRPFGLQLYHRETFKLSTDSLFVAKVSDIVGLYLNSPDHAPELCVNEKSRIRALDLSQARCCRCGRGKPSCAAMIADSGDCVISH